MEYLELIGKIIGVSSLTYLWVYSEPTELFRDWLINVGVLKEGGFLHRLLTCTLCFGLWMGLIYVFLLIAAPLIILKILDMFLLACIISIVSALIDNKLNT